MDMPTFEVDIRLDTAFARTAPSIDVDVELDPGGGGKHLVTRGRDDEAQDSGLRVRDFDLGDVGCRLVISDGVRDGQELRCDVTRTSAVRREVDRDQLAAVAVVLSSRSDPEHAELGTLSRAALGSVRVRVPAVKLPAIPVAGRRTSSDPAQRKKRIPPLSMNRTSASSPSSPVLRFKSRSNHTFTQLERGSV